MKKLLFPALLLAGLLAGSPAQAFTLEEFTFEDETRQREFRELIEELRCLVCQNESLAGSQADLAQDLRMEVYKMFQTGKSRDEIVEFLVARYGDFVLYEPPLRPSTYLIWFGPAVLVAVGSFMLFSTVRGKRSAREQELSDADHDRLDALLAENGAASPNREDGSKPDNADPRERT